MESGFSKERGFDGPWIRNTGKKDTLQKRILAFIVIIFITHDVIRKLLTIIRYIPWFVIHHVHTHIYIYINLNVFMHFKPFNPIRAHGERVKV